MSVAVQNATSLPFYTPSTSAAGIIAYLDEKDNELKIRALQKLFRIVDLHWAEVCDSLPLIEELSEDPTFAARELAAALASKCFYHLQEYNDSLRLALNSGSYFNIYNKSEYVETLLSKCIDEYNELRKKQEKDESVYIDPRMENIVEQMFLRCYRDHCFEQAVGIALDTRRIDKVEETCAAGIAANRASILGYTFSLCQGARNITNREFRLSVISTLVKLYSTLAEPDYANVCAGLQYLNRAEDAARILNKLCKGSLENALQAYQISFDMQETENQGFVLQVVANFPELQSNTPESSANGTTVGSQEQKSNQEDDTTNITSSTSESIEVEMKEVDPDLTVDIEVYHDRLGKLKRILVDGFDVDLTLNFLFRHNRGDVTILKNIKQAIEGRTAILHNNTVVAHAYMNSGTTIDSFLRDNLEWLGKASNWAKFTAVASIGVVHKGHVHESMNLLQPYLPRGGMSSSPYSESGALYALGLIHFNKGGTGSSKTISYLSDALKNAGTNEVVQHGACLGIGLAAMATGSESLFEELKGILFTDSAVAGEGAALSIGMLLVGLSDSPLAQNAIIDLINYAHDTSHEKIVRALALSIAMMVYGKEEGADGLIEQLSRDRDPIVRYGAMYAVAMAYCGTGDNGAVRRLLHVAVSDVNDDVRRAAVTCLGFVMFRSPESVPSLVSLLAESFNPHVRYGACMAIGIACAGTANKDAIELLQTLLEDHIDFVRQAGFLSMALVLMQTSEARSPAVKKFNEMIMSVIADKHQPIMAKSGAILAAGILDAGGRNVVVCMQSRGGFLKMGSVVGMMLWLQYWYWYPLMHFLSLTFSATALIGLNKDFDMPNNFTMKCNAPESMFAYPKVEEKKEEKRERVATAILSTTKRAKAREVRKQAEAKKLQAAAAAAAMEVATAATTKADVADSATSTTAETIESASTAIPMDTTDSKSVSEKTVTFAEEVAVATDATAPVVSTTSPMVIENNHLGAVTEAIPSTTTTPSPSLPTMETLPLPPSTTSSTTPTTTASITTADASTSTTTTTTGKKEKEKESNFFILSNPSRLIPAQLRYMSPPDVIRYIPIDSKRTATGVVILLDQAPEQPEDVSKVEKIVFGQEEEAEIPQPFEWDPNQE